MVFLGIYRAIYDYKPQGDNELALTEGDVLMVLDKSADDGWWKAKKKLMDEDGEEPEGLVPNNYIEEVSCTTSFRHLCLYRIDARSIGPTDSQGQSPLRLLPPNRRRALFWRGSHTGCLRHLGRGVDTGGVEWRLWLRSSKLYRAKAG
jgi:hypothetical protein